MNLKNTALSGYATIFLPIYVLVSNMGKHYKLYGRHYDIQVFI
jgi:hypothetical protein